MLQYEDSMKADLFMAACLILGSVSPSDEARISLIKESAMFIDTGFNTDYSVEQRSVMMNYRAAVLVESIIKTDGGPEEMAAYTILCGFPGAKREWL